MKEIYLDNAATTAVSNEVLTEMLPAFNETFGNPNSLHSFGREALKMVDAATLKELKENAFIYEGVTLEMLMGQMTTQDKEAFYENWIEPAAISLGQAMSKVFFSQWQTSHGDQIVLYPHKVQLMATSEIVSIIQSTISAGVFKIDEYREMLGYPPLENGEGEQRPRGFNNLDGNNTGGGATE